MAWTPPPQPTPFNKAPEDILFLDIETVPKVHHYQDLDEFGKRVFEKRFRKEISKMIEGGDDHVGSGQVIVIGDNIEQLWQDKAALHCEFNKIACVTMAVFAPGNEGQRTLRVKSHFGYNEQIIISELSPKLGKAKFLCAHNGKLFDFPLLARKYIQHGLVIPSILNVTGIKPWDVNQFDTLEIWRFNDFQNYVSIESLAYVLGLPSPKESFDASQVVGVYYGPKKRTKDELPWDDKTLKPIATYCEGDVITLAQVYLRMINQPVVKPENILIV